MSFLAMGGYSQKEAGSKTPGSGFNPVNLIADKLPSGSACFLF